MRTKLKVNDMSQLVSQALIVLSNEFRNKKKASREAGGPCVEHLPSHSSLIIVGMTCSIESYQGNKEKVEKIDSDIDLGIIDITPYPLVEYLASHP